MYVTLQCFLKYFFIQSLIKKFILEIFDDNLEEDLYSLASWILYLYYFHLLSWNIYTLSLLDYYLIKLILNFFFYVCLFLDHDESFNEIIASLHDPIVYWVLMLIYLWLILDFCLSCHYANKLNFLFSPPKYVQLTERLICPLTWRLYL